MAVLAATRSYTSLDGSAVTVSPPPKVKPFSSIAVATFTRPAIGRLELTAGPRTLARDLAFDPELAVATDVREQYSHSGGTLTIATGTSPAGADGRRHWDLGPDGTAAREAVTYALWEGAGFSLLTHVYGPAGPARDRLMRAFLQIRVTEHDDGLSVAPYRDAVFYLDDGPVILQDVSKVALVEIMQLTQRNAAVLPARRGTRVTGGELFAHVPPRAQPGAGASSDAEPGHAHTHGQLAAETFLRKVTPSAIATILPHPQAGEDDVMALATELTVDWTGG